MEIDDNLALNQVQILNIIKSIYANDLKNEQNMNVARQRRAAASETQSTSGNDYAEYYRKVNDFGKMKHWTQDKINKMLSNKQAFNKEYNLHMRQKERFRKGQVDETPAYIQRLHDHALEREVKHLRAREAKDKAESEEAYLMSTQ